MVMILLLFNLFEIGINGSYIFSFSMKTFSLEDSWKFWKWSDRVVQQLRALATKPADPETQQWKERITSHLYARVHAPTHKIYK